LNARTGTHTLYFILAIWNSPQYCYR
jgi:hypothetical protein